MHVRHCPRCRTDYRPEIVSCADCGQPLVDRDDEQDVGEAQDGAGDGLAEVPEAFEPLFTAGHVRDLTPLADRLVTAGIKFHLRDARQGCRVVGYRLLVHIEDHARAREVAADLTEGVTVLGAGQAHGSDPDAFYARCPACETPLSPGALACPECGLPLGEQEPTCPGCGRPVNDDSAGRCRSCGTDLLDGQ